MGSETYTISNAPDALLYHGNSRLIPAETSLNFEDVFLPYPSSPVEPGVGEPFPTEENLTPFSSPTSTISDSTAGSGEVNVSMSTSFNPTSHAVTPDIIFNTSDNVLFYAHSQVLRGFSPETSGRVPWSQNKVNPTSQGMVELDTIHDVPDSSTVFNIVLHTLYGTSPAQNSPSFEALLTAVDRMFFYGIDPKDFITRHAPLYQLLLAYAPLHPLHVYSLAGHHELEDLAVSSSSHLLSFPISSLPDEMAIRMGSIYLKRLACLHLNRTNVLKQVLLVPPPPHAPTRKCGFPEQKPLTRAWALVAAYLAWDARPDFSTSSMKKAFQPLIEILSCELCLLGLEKRVKEIVDRWASVKPTI